MVTTGLTLWLSTILAHFGHGMIWNVSSASSRVRTGGRVAVALAALGLIVGSAVVAPTSSEPATTYAAVSAGLWFVDVAAGTALLLAGTAAALGRRWGAVGPLVAGSGVAWFAGDWVGWEDGPAPLRSVAMVAMLLLPALLVHLARAYPQGAPSTLRWTVAVWLAYLLVGGTAVSIALVKDPFEEVHCWRNCRVNSFLVRDQPELARWLTELGLRTAVVLGLLVAASCVWRLARATSVARRMFAPVVAPLAVVALIEALSAAVLLLDPAEDPERALFAGVFVARAGSLTALAVGVAWVLLRELRSRRGLDRIVREFGDAPEPGSLEQALTRALRDPELSVHYWLPSSGRFVDSTGGPTSPAPRVGQTTTTITRAGQTVAVVVHDASTAASRIGATVRLAVDNERLRAEVLSQIDDLRLSQQRIVARADATRRSIERDLHDGAQQRLLAASYELRLAASAARRERDDELERVLSGVLTETQDAMRHLRELAHGIFPAILAEAGLGPAVLTLAAGAPIPVELSGFDNEIRLRAGVELAVYRFVDIAITDAAARCATHVRIEIDFEPGRVVVEARDDGRPYGPAHVELSDRIGAVGGTAQIDAARRRAVLPCG